MQLNKIMDLQLEFCEYCGAVVRNGNLGCQKLFEQVLERIYSDHRYAKPHRLIVDAYSMQHPEKYMRSGKSFAAHLTGMCAVWEYENSFEINTAVQEWLNGKRTLVKPTQIPEERGDLKISYILGAIDVKDHHKRVWNWSQLIWNAWAEHHDLARHWIGEASSRK